MEINPERLSRIADFFNEAGMLKNISRSGFAFLGTGRENVAEHSFRTSIIGFVLAKLAGANIPQVTFLCLFHDLHEARTGDFNYVNHLYNQCNAEQALVDALEGTGLEECIMDFWKKLEADDSLEAHLAHDADQLDLICNLQMELSKGNEFAKEWLDSALKRLKTPLAREIAEAILKTDPNNWWYGRVNKNWWVDRDRT